MISVLRIAVQRMPRTPLPLLACAAGAAAIATSRRDAGGGCHSGRNPEVSTGIVVEAKAINLHPASLLWDAAMHDQELNKNRKNTLQSSCLMAEVSWLTDSASIRCRLDALGAIVVARHTNRPAHFCQRRGPDHQRGIVPGLSERASLPRGDARISTRAALPFDRSAPRKMPRLYQGPHCVARVWRTRCGGKDAVANRWRGQGQGSVGAPGLSLGFGGGWHAKPGAVRFGDAEEWCER
jgi:hypothetical protein